jgi:glycosyltransferase involved in cell wall biosynthesis
MLKTLRRNEAGRSLRVIVMFHAVQWPLTRALLVAEPQAVLWYSRWDRYEFAYDANAKQQARLVAAHRAAATRSSLTFAVSDELARLEREEGRQAYVIPSAADSFPALASTAQAGSIRRPAGAVAVSLGGLGWRNDWRLLRYTLSALPDLRLHLIGRWEDGECASDPDYVALRAEPRVTWHGRISDQEAADVIALSDVGLIPFTRSEFNNAGLPNRILKYARMGRRTISLQLDGARTWEGAVNFASGAQQYAALIAAAAGARAAPDLELRDWALRQTARATNKPLWEALKAAGVDLRGS